MKLKQLPLLAACAIVTVSCTDYKAQISALQEEIYNLEVSVTEIGTFADNLGAVRDVLAFNQSGDFIQSVTPVDGGYAFVFKNNGSVTVGNATGGVSVSGDESGYFWTLNGQILKDATGSNASTKVIAKFRAQDGKRLVSTDGGKSWTDLPSSADNLITKIEENATSVTVTFLGGTVVVFAKEDPLKVLISGNSEPLASQGKAAVYYLISGGSGEYSIATSQPAGWSPQIEAENGSKGQIIFVSSGNPESDEVKIYFCDTAGHMVVSTLNLASMTINDDYPILSPSYEAYNIACEGGSLDVKVTTNLEYEAVIESSATGWLSITGTKALREDEITFSATANGERQMRSAQVTLKNDVYSKTIVVYQDGIPAPIGQNLSENGTANCYIIPAAGDYYFDATVIGNGQGGIMKDAGFHTENAAISPVEVEILTEFNDEPLIDNLRLEGGKVCFHANGNKGNLTLYVTGDDGDLLWSWHLWCTDIPVEKTHTNSDGSRFTLMDRNLGAVSANPEDGELTYGLYYQWGRKDPFDGEAMKASMTSNTAGTITYGVIRPFRPLKTDRLSSFNWITTLNDNLWGNPDYRTIHPLEELTKTIYDPCPPGYMVPPASVYVAFGDETRLEYIVNGLLFRGDFGQISFYPYAGRAYQGSYEAFGHDPDEIYIAMWSSGISTYNTNVFDGGSSLQYRVKTLSMTINQGDFRGRGIPVRCVKQK